MTKQLFLQIERLILNKFSFTYKVDLNGGLEIKYGTGSCRIFLEFNLDTTDFLLVLRKHKNGKGTISRKAMYLTRYKLEGPGKKVKAEMHKLIIGVVTEPDLIFHGRTYTHRARADEAIYFAGNTYRRVNENENCYILETSYDQLFKPAV